MQDVEAADIYVGMIAWRYGYVPVKNNPDKRSITELEYLKAFKSHKQCLIFLLEKNAPWSPQFMDVQSGEKDAGKNISTFRAELAERHTIAWFNNPDQLASDVLAAVYQVEFAGLIKPAPKVNSQISKASPNNVSTPQAVKKVLSRNNYPKLWKPGITLRVSFLDGSPKQKTLIRRFAPIWSAYANISFEFGNTPDGELRVSFKEEGSWAYVGTDALTVGKGQPTINFGWLSDNIADTEAHSIILREFGHVLGLLNEHQNPLENIPWNKQAVYKTFGGPPNNWSREAINHNFFSHWDKKFFPTKKPFDPQSIMAFPIPSEFTNGNFKIGPNTDLSIGDKEFVSQLYPFEAKKKPRNIKSTKN